MKISVEEYSQALSDEAPCGEDLEYDPSFQQVEAMLASQGEDVIDGEEDGGPDWKALSEPLLDLMYRTRDLRVFVNTAIAGLNLEGIPVFHQTLQTLNNCMEAFWTDIHPQLDEDDGFDPMMRMNVLQNLTHYEHVRQGLKLCPLVELKGVGSFSLRDVEIATGKENPAEGEEVMDPAIVEGAFRDADPGYMAELSEAINGSLEEIERMLNIWAEKTDNWEAPALDPTVAILREVASTLSAYAPGLDADAGEVVADGAIAGEGAVASVPGAITSRSDVVTTLERICEYYRVAEPSSPIPFMLERCKALVHKDFMEILYEIAPEGMATAKMVTGYQDEESQY